MHGQFEFLKQYKIILPTTYIPTNINRHHISRLNKSKV